MGCLKDEFYHADVPATNRIQRRYIYQGEGAVSKDNRYSCKPEKLKIVGAI